MTLYTTLSTDCNPKINSGWRGQILLHQVFPDCDVFTNCCRLPAEARHQATVCVYSQHATLLWPSLFPSRWTRVNTAVRSSATGPCAACAVCQSPASALTGPQTPVDSTPTCPSISQATQLPRQPQNPRACLSIKTNFILHFICTTAHHSFIHPSIH